MTFTMQEVSKDRRQPLEKRSESEMASPAIRVSQYEEAKKDQDEDDDLDKELESYIAESDKKKEEDTKEEKVKDNDSISSESSKSSDSSDKDSKKDKQESKGDDTEKAKSADTEQKEADVTEKKEAEVAQQKDIADDTTKGQSSKKGDTDDVAKDEKENVSSGGKERQKSPDDEDSEPDEYTLTEDQQRALREMEELRREMGLPEEDPPEYDVRERLKSLNEELANDPTPVEKHTSKVGFKDNLVDLVAPPPDYPDEETPRNQENTGGTSDSFSAKSQDTDKMENDKGVENDNEEDKKVSENVKSDNSNDKKKGSDQKVLIEKDGKFELVSSDDVRAKDLGLPLLDEENTNNNSNNSASNSQEDLNRVPAPPSHPRPSTANGNARRNVRVSSSRQRASSAGPHRGSALDQDFNYNSPYAMSKQDKELLEKQKKYKEEQMKEKQKQEKREKEDRERENNDAFQYWLKQKREEMREKRKRDEEERKRNGASDRRKHGSDDSLVTGSYHSDSDQSNGLEAYDQLFYNDTDDSKREAYQSWLKEKVDQNKREKLLKRRQEMEATDGFYIRTREECDKAFRQWLRQKNTEARKARMVERQRAKIHRLAARRARKSSALSKAIVQSNAFRYVDYYGYRY